jgi:hypothetical protein
MADDIAQLGADLDALMVKARLLEQAYDDVLVVNRPFNDLLGAAERLRLVADFARHLYGQPMQAEPVSQETPQAYSETVEPLPHERKPTNPKLSEALRRDGS